MQIFLYFLLTDSFNVAATVEFFTSHYVSTASNSEELTVTIWTETSVIPAAADADAAAADTAADAAAAATATGTT